MKKILIIICLFISIMSYANEYKLSNVEVVDGDGVKATISLGFGISMIKAKIRLAGIDCPETRTKDLLQKKAGLLVKLWLSKKIKNGSVFKLITNDKHEFGKFGRPMGILYIDNLNMCQLMVRLGYTKLYFGQKKEEWLRFQLNYIIQQLEEN